MKKIIIFSVIFVIIVCIILFSYNSILTQKKQIQEENSIYEQYLNKEIYGIDIATIINKAVDSNTKNGISKDENDYFIENDENSVEIEIYLKESDKTYKMEQIYKQGTEQFVQFFIDSKFKSSKVEYHEKTGKIKYVLLEQI